MYVSLFCQPEVFSPFYPTSDLRNVWQNDCGAHHNRSVKEHLLSLHLPCLNFFKRKQWCSKLTPKSDGCWMSSNLLQLASIVSRTSRCPNGEPLYRNGTLPDCLKCCITADKLPGFCSLQRRRPFPSLACAADVVSESIPLDNFQRSKQRHMHQHDRDRMGMT